MVAVVSGTGLGLTASSWSMLGGQGASGTASQGRSGERVYINSATGNLIIQGQDDYLGATGLDLSLIRTYNSQGYLNDDNGDNWRLSAHRRLHTRTGTINGAGSTITKTFGDGADVVYSYDASLGKYLSTAGNGAHDTLSYNATSQEWTWTDGSSQATETYDSALRLTTSRDTDGNATTYQYTGELLTRIQDASGQITWLDYTDGNLTQIRVESNNSTQTLTRYAYDSQDRLTEVRVDLSPGDNSIGDNNVYVTTYTYDGATHRIASIAQTDGTSVSFTYENVNGVYRVKTYAQNDGAPITLPANPAALTTSEPQNTTNQYNLINGVVTPQGWTTDNTISALIRYAANGNAIALGSEAVYDSNFAFLHHRIFVRNYDAATGVWSAPITINQVTDPQLWQLTLDVDAAGNAVAAWQTSNGSNNINSTLAWVSAATYDAATQTWSDDVLLDTIPTPQVIHLGHKLTAEIRGSNVVVAYEADVTNPPNNPYHTRSTTVISRRNGVWSKAILGATHSQNSAQDNIVVRIAPNGDILALYVVSDSETSGPFVPGEVFFSKLAAGSSTWNTPQLIGSRTNQQPPNETVIVDFEIDDNGNGVLFWTTASTTTVQTQRYNAATGAWTAVESLPYGSENYGLSVDHNGTAVWTYIASSTVYVRIFDPTSNVWGAAIAVPGSNTGSLRFPMAVIRNGRVAVSWSSYNASTGVRMMVSQRIDGVWTTPAVARSGEIYVEPQMDEQGNIALGNSIYHPDSSYLIPAGATWASIAQTLYGTSAGGSALQAALANPPLTAGTRLRNLPSTLSVTTTVMVPVTPYYTVLASDTWSSITQAVYGTNDTNVVTALKNALGDPALTPGAHLTVPLSLSATPVGHVTTFTYTGTQTDVQSPTGQVTSLIADSQGQLLSMLSPTVNGARLTQTFTYDASGNVTSVTADPSGANLRTDFEYDANGNLILSRDALGHTVKRTYNSANQLVTESVFSVADPDGAGTGQPSGAMTSRSVYDSEQHLRFTVSADGRVVEYRYDAAGNRVAVLKYTGAIYDVSALPPTTALSAATLETWVGSQNLTQVERTDYTYDFRGNISTATTYEQTNSSGAGVVSTAAVTHFVYDQRGKLLQTTDARGANYVTNFTYDGLGRLLTTSQWRSAGVVNTTVNTYDDAHRQSTTTLANGLVTTNLYDRNGRLISVAQSDPERAYGTTTYGYDVLGRLRLTTDAENQIQHVLYDAAGRKSATIDADGTLTEFVYDGASRLVKTVVYFDRLTTATRATLLDVSGNPADVSVATLVATLTSAPGYNAALNRLTRAVYDRSGQLVFAIDPSGAVTQNFYDGAGRLTDTVEYATRVVISASVNALAPIDVVVTGTAQDRRTRNFHNGDGALLGTLDAGGYLVTYTYDGAGHLIKQMGYASPTPAQHRAAGTLGQLIPAVSEDDIVSYFLYDDEGRRVGVVDAENYLTETRYDNAGNISQVIRYATAVNYTGSGTLDGIRPSGVSHSTTYQYDGANNLTTETDHHGTVTSRTYNSVGQVIATTVAAGTDEQRTTYMRYDGLGRIVAELTAEGVTKLTAGMSQEQIDLVWTQYGVRHVYDSVGRRTSSTDQNGYTSLFFYDLGGRLTHTVNALGEVTEAIFDGLGQLSQQIVYTNRISVSGLSGGAVNGTLTSRLTAAADASKDTKTTFTYTQTGQVASSVTAMGATTTHAYNAFGEERERLDKVDGTRWLRKEFTYNNRGLLELTRTDQSGFNTTVSAVYDAFGRAITVTDARSQSTHYEYDRLGRQIATVDALNSRRTTSYDAFSRTLTMSDGLLNVTQYAYNDALRTTTLTTPEQVVVTTTYSRLGQVVSVTAAGNTKTYTYTENGDLETVVDNLGTLESHQYDRAGRELVKVNARGVSTSISYDAANRVLTRTVDSTGVALTTTYTYDGQGRVTRVTEPKGRITETTYDADSRVTLVVIDPATLNLRTSYEYNLAGDVITVTEGVDPAKLARTRYEYDVLGRRTKEIVELERSGATVTKTNTTLYSYDANGNLSRKIDGNNATTWYVYDAANNLRFTVDALGGVTENTYDAKGRVIGVKRYATPVSTGGFGEVLSSVPVSANPAADRFTQTIYDRDGRAVYTVDTLGGVTQRVFDTNGNVTRERVISTKVAQATYTTVAAIEGALAAVGANTAQVAAADRVAWTVYDVRGEAVFRVNGDYSVVRSAYDGNGNVTSTTEYATRIAAQSGSYDLATLTAWANGSGANAALDRTTLYWYDGVDRLRFTRDAEGFMHETRFDDAARTEKETLYRNVSSMTAANSYAQVATAYANGLIERQTTTVRDVAGRVTDVIDINGNFDHYTYDEVGNKRTFQNKAGNVWTYDYDANHRLISETGPAIDITTVYVDGNGRLASQTSQDVHLVTTMTYDALGNLKTRTEAANTGQARTTSYTYDALGRQTRTDFPAVLVYNAAADNPNAAGAAETSTSLYSETAYDTLGNAFRSRDIGGAYSFKVYDALGRVTYDVDAANNVSQYTYDTFGNQTLLVRYANPLQTALPTNSSSINASHITGGNNLQPNAAVDRSITTDYDRLNRVTQVTQSVEYNYHTNANAAGGHPSSAAATTKTEYSAFGQVARTMRLVDPSAQTWAETTYYYDRLGRKTAEVDPMGYATQYGYDNSGNLTSKIEFARQAARGATFVPPAAGSSSDTLGRDRIYSYVYDKLDRLLSESLTNYEYRLNPVNPYDAQTTFWTKSYGYDLLGNKTTETVNGAKSYTYYDAMGRALFVAGPMRHIGDVQELVTLVEMRRDAFGALVEQIQYANNASSPNETAPPFIAESTLDRHNFFQVDKLGHTVRTQDAAGVSRYASYTARGDVAKEWQTVTNNSTTEALVTSYQYDALGRQTAVTQPQSTAAVVKRNSHYNAFGEIDRQWATVDGVDQVSEYFHYDRAGRVWRTNSGDGVYKVYLYDLDGNATVEIRSQIADLNSLASAASALALPANQQMRTETAYDANGRVIQQRMPEYTIESTQALIDAYPSISVYPLTTPPNAIYQRIQFGDFSEFYIASGAPYSEGGGYVQIQAPSSQYPQGLYSRVSEAEYSTSNVRQFAWYATTQLDVVATFEYWLPSNPGVRHSLPVNSIFGAMFSVNINNLPAGQYGYKISYTRTGASSAFATQEGTFDPTTHVTPTGGSSTQTQTAAPKITQVFDRWDNAISVTDAAQQTTLNYYNQFGKLVRSVLPSVRVVDTAIIIQEFVDRPQNFYFYDQYGQFRGKVMGLTKDAGYRPYDQYLYNEVGQLTSIIHPGGDSYAGSTTRNIYDAFGQVLQVTDEVGYRTRNTYDKAGRLVRVAKEVVQGGFAYANSYGDDTASNSTAVIYETYTYDEAGRRIAETNGEGEITRYRYDLHGNVIARRTPLGYETTYSYDFNGNKVAETDANGSFSTWSYNAFSVLTAHTGLQNVTEAAFAYGWGGGTAYSYQYNRAGYLTLQTSNGGQHIEYSYDAAGHVKVINDTGTNVGRVTSYTYDAAGRKVRDTVTVNGDVHQDSRLTYDALGRLSSVDDPDYRVHYEYDGAGNRTVITANYVDHTGAQLEQDELLYRYDDRGFMTVSQGRRADGIHIDTYAVPGAADITYDARGLRTSVRTDGKRWNQTKYRDEFGNIYQGAFIEINPNTGRSTEYYTYDGLGRLTTVGLETWTELRDYYTGELVGGDSIPETKLTRVYDKASRVLQEDTLFAQNSGKHHRVSNSSFDDDGRIQDQWTYKDGVLESHVLYGTATPVMYEDGSWYMTQGFDAAGVLRGYSVAVYNSSGAWSYTNTFQMTYQLGEAYQESGQTVSVIGSGPLGGQTGRQYNANGELIRFIDYQDQTRNRYFASDAQGNVLTTIQGRFDGASGRMTVAQAWDSAIARSTWLNQSNQAKAQHFFFADGRYVGSFGQLQSANGAFEANFDVNFTPVSPETLAATPGQVIAQSGDTLRGIAARVWGDATLWYLIADANGLTDPDAVITEGLALTLPNEIVSLSNTADSFKPFNMADALGDTTPTQPMPPPPRGKKGCGVFGQILVIIVAVVVTVVIQDYSGSVLGMALGAAAGSAASQGVAIAIGQQESFSWKGVAAAALTAGMAPGVGNLASNIVSNQIAQQVVTAALNSAVSQGVNIALGLQEKFSWGAVAAAAVAAPIASKAGKAVNDDVLAKSSSKMLADVAGRFASGGIQQIASVGFNGGRIDYANLVGDAFGNALGNSIVDRLTPQPATERARPSLNFDAEIEAGIAGTRARIDARLLAMSETALNNNPKLLDPAASLTPDQQRSLKAYQETEAAQPPTSSEPAPSGPEEVVVTASRMTPQEMRAYDAREALRTMLNGVLTQHRREQQARNMVEAEMSAGQRALVSLGGIMYNGYQSVKSGVVGLKDLAVSAYEWDQRVIGDLLHGDFRAAAGEYADAFGLGVEKAKAFVAGAQSLGTVLADAESRDMLLDFAKEYYGTSSQVTQSELLGKLPMELLIAAGTAGAGEVISAAGIPQRLGGAINSLADAIAGTRRVATAAEGSAVDRLLFGARVGDGLPGTTGVPIPGRPTPVQLENLTVKHNVEFGVSYKLGPGEGGGGGQYFLHSGTKGQVSFPLEGDRMVIYHTHPRGTPYASQDDMDMIKLFQQAGSPQKSSQIVPVGKDVVRFGTDYNRR